jgi:AcrR family transcriptional regulator
VNGRAIVKREKGKRTAAETKAEIYREARTIFNRKGYVAMTLREVAAGVGIEAQSLYNYTSSKQGLVVSLMKEGTEAIQEVVDAAIESAEPSPTARLWAAVAAHTKHYCSSDKVMLVREGLVHLDSDHRADLVAMLKKYEDTFKGILADGVRLAEFRSIDITPTCFAILGMGESVVNWFDRGRRLDADAVASCYAELAVRSVTAQVG